MIKWILKFMGLCVHEYEDISKLTIYGVSDRMPEEKFIKGVCIFQQCKKCKILRKAYLDI